jgi:hypothetical protein
MPTVPAQPPVIRLRLEDARGAALSSATYTIQWQNGPQIYPPNPPNTTDKDGVLVEQIPPGARTARVELSTPKWSVLVSVESFGDAATPLGLAARLENLGLAALPPFDKLAAALPENVTIAAQRYKAQKQIPLSSLPDRVQQLITRDHDDL